MTNLPHLDRSSSQSIVTSNAISATTSLPSYHTVQAITSGVSARYSNTAEEEQACIQVLPVELLQKIFGEMSIVDVANCASVSKLWRDLAVETLKGFLDRHNLLENDTMVSELATQVRAHYTLQNLLVHILELSKQDKTIANLAAKAITLLNAAKISFSMRNLEGVQIPGALLDGAVMDSTNLRGADLSHVQFNRAWLRNADLSGSVLTNAQFAQVSRNQKKFVHEYHVQHRNSFDSTDFISSAISTDQQFLATFISPKADVKEGSSWKNVIHISHIDSQRWIHTLTGHTDDVLCVAFSGNGKFLASGSRDKSVKIWDVTTGECLQTLVGHESEVSCVASNWEGTIWASGSDDGVVNLWDAQCNYFLRSFSKQEGKVKRVVLSGDGRFLAISSMESQSDDVYQVRLWDLATTECLFVDQANVDFIDKLIARRNFSKESEELLYELNGIWKWLFNKQEDKYYLWSANNPMLNCEGIKADQAVGLSDWNKLVFEWCGGSRPVSHLKDLLDNDDTSSSEVKEAVLALVKTERKYGLDHEEVIHKLMNLRSAYSTKKSYHRAVLCSERALNIAEKIWGPDDHAIAAILCRVGRDHIDFYDALSNVDSLICAKKYLKRASAIVEKSTGPNDRLLGLILEKLAFAYLKLNIPSKAKMHAQASYNIYLQNFGYDNPLLMGVADLLARCENALTGA